MINLLRVAAGHVECRVGRVIEPFRRFSENTEFKNKFIKELSLVSFCLAFHCIIPSSTNVLVTNDEFY